jgi:predicted DsbA family dithiol-disulfide isomerase
MGGSHEASTPDPNTPQLQPLASHCGVPPLEARTHAEEHMRQLGVRAGVAIDYDVQTNWQPVDSQRVMLWAAREGKAEAYMEAVGRGPDPAPSTLRGTGGPGTGAL